MLCLTMELDEAIVLELESGDCIDVVITKIRGENDRGRVSIGIDEPDNVKILREELLEFVSDN